MSDTTPNMPAVEIALRTDPGRDPDKQVNEDSAGHLETRLGVLAVVCDGMGGHAGGKEASELALKTILDCVEHAKPDRSPREALVYAIEEANRRVWGMPTAEHGLRPGSTVVAVLAHSRGAEVAHVGDSRVYLVHAGAISQVTKDHSMVQEMVDRNLIRAEDAAAHPDANKIMRALGIAGECEVDARAEPIAYVTGDVFVLCSDGLSDLVGAGEILQVAGAHPPAQAAGQLVDLANARGGHDNVTAMVVRMKSTAETGGSATIVKTVPVTQALPPLAAKDAKAPPDAGSGPRGTLLEAPVAGAHVAAPAALPPNASGPQIAIPAAPPPPSSQSGGRSRVPLFVLGILLALAGLVVAGILVWMEMRPRHPSVPVVPVNLDAGASPSATIDEDAAAANPVVTATPPLTDPPICLKARAARMRGSPFAPKLEDQCRAAGGVVGPVPSGSAPPVPAPTAAPTPVPSPTPVPPR